MNNNIKKTKITLTGAGLGAAMLLMSSAASAGGQAVPTGLNDYLVFMANGTVPLKPHPDVPGCGMGIFCDGQYFQEVIMGRAQGEIDAAIDKAKAYWRERFGVDADTTPGVMLSSFMIDPRGEYRVYTAADDKVPAEGWEIRDGGFALQVTAPDGVELGGEFAGQVAPQGTMMLYGDYNILTTNKNGIPKGEFVVSYRSDTPTTINQWGELVINCQVSTDGFAGGVNNGKAQGMGLPLVPGPDGYKLVWRNVVTFSDNGGL